MLAPLHWALITHVYGCFLGILRILPQHKTHKTHTEAEINAQTVLAMKEASVVCGSTSFWGLSAVVWSIGAMLSRPMKSWSSSRNRWEWRMHWPQMFNIDMSCLCAALCSTVQHCIYGIYMAYWKPRLPRLPKGRKTHRRYCGHASRDEGVWNILKPSFRMFPYVSVALCCEWTRCAPRLGQGVMPKRYLCKQF